MTSTCGLRSPPHQTHHLFNLCAAAQIQLWLQEHQEMIKCSLSWMEEAQSWLVAPCTYTTAKCLSSHVHALQVAARRSTST